MTHQSMSMTLHVVTLQLNMTSLTSTPKKKCFLWWSAEIGERNCFLCSSPCKRWGNWRPASNHLKSLGSQSSPSRFAVKSFPQSRCKPKTTGNTALWVCERYTPSGFALNAVWVSVWLVWLVDVDFWWLPYQSKSSLRLSLWKEILYCIYDELMGLWVTYEYSLQ